MRKVHIIILPPEEILEKAMRVSSTLSGEFESFFALHPSNAMGHITLSQAECEEHDVPRIIEAMRTLAAKTKTFTATFDGTGSHDGWYWLTSHTPELLELQKSVVAAVQPATSLTADPNEIPLHMTISRIKNSSKEKEARAEAALREAWGELPESFEAAQIAIGTPAEHGEFQQLTHIFNLSA